MILRLLQSRFEKKIRLEGDKPKYLFTCYNIPIKNDLIKELLNNGRKRIIARFIE